MIKKEFIPVDTLIREIFYDNELSAYEEGTISEATKMAIDRHHINKEQVIDVLVMLHNFKKDIPRKKCAEDDKNNLYRIIINYLSLNKNALGNDPIDGYKISILGKFKDIVSVETQIKRGNEKMIIEEVNSKIKAIVGYDSFFHEGGNHIVFKNKREEDLYVIMWEFDPNYKETILRT